MGLQPRGRKKSHLFGTYEIDPFTLTVIDKRSLRMSLDESSRSATPDTVHGFFLLSHTFSSIFP